MSVPRVLLVDDDEVVRFKLVKVLEEHGFEITTASNVPEALRSIGSDEYDVLLSDLRAPGPGDGLTVVSAMRQANPRAVTLLLHAEPEVEMTDAIFLQADEVMIRKTDAATLLELIKQKLVAGAASPRAIETVASILERTMDDTILHWLSMAQASSMSAEVPVPLERRAGYLKRILRDIVARLRLHEPLGTHGIPSPNAVAHGIARRMQGYSAAMVVEESRFLQVSIFQTLQNNLNTIDFSVVLRDVMTIADEVDFQLAQMLESFADKQNEAI
ncbi:response regulator [Granulicella sibirica]|uniref:Response regulator receiver protein n=1 Tax=Granulicella sibirica TaxID=2479048 RepID=A0A4Q0T214_9BACT|nr:response regulator [Granulicella sibirica]RXH57227.1 response regulator receiver protein [Granulicella sibirica]